ncbi:MAG TPA: hypothetical protein VHS03_10440 [Gaiellaceae bacterium]|jgi:hypothetical protein|nr:hypothetical protein [Gaiellaceae bacterium]
MRAFVACLAVVAAIALPGVIVAATTSSARVQEFQSITGSVAVGYGRAQPVTAMSPAAGAVSAAVAAEFRTDGVDLSPFLPLAKDAFDAIQSGSAKCPVDVVVNTGAQARAPFLSRCTSRTTRVRGVWVTYSPLSAGPTVEQAVANLR